MRTRSTISVALSTAVVAVLLVSPETAHGVAIDDYMIVATAPGSIGDALQMSDSEIGRIGSKGTPTSPAIPGGISGPSTGIALDGDVAITSTTGKVNLSNSDVHATVKGPGSLGMQGIDCASSFSTCDDGGLSNSQFNTTAPAPSFTAIADTNGIQGEPSVTGLLGDLTSLNSSYWGLANTGTLSGNEVNNTTLTLSYTANLNVIDILNGTNDYKMSNSNFIVSGDADTFVIFRLGAGGSFVLNNVNLLLTGGIGLNNVLFLVNADSGDTSFNFNNVIFNGYSFWDFGGIGTGNIANFSDLIGCGQVITDKVQLSNVSMTGCEFNYVEEEEPPPPIVPEPGSLALLGLGLLGLGLTRRKAA